MLLHLSNCIQAVLSFWLPKLIPDIWQLDQHLSAWALPGLCMAPPRQGTCLQTYRDSIMATAVTALQHTGKPFPPALLSPHVHARIQAYAQERASNRSLPTGEPMGVVRGMWLSTPVSTLTSPMLCREGTSSSAIWLNATWLLPAVGAAGESAEPGMPCKQAQRTWSRPCQSRSDALWPRRARQDYQARVGTQNGLPQAHARPVST